MFKSLMKEWLENEGGLDVLKMQTATSATPLIEFVEWLDTRLLTTDAPEMTVGDSCSVSKHSTNKAAQKGDDWEYIIYGVGWYTCRGCHHTHSGAAYYSPKGTKYCKECGDKRRSKTTKPDNRTPSPTPSFR